VVLARQQPDVVHWRRETLEGQVPARMSHSVDRFRADEPPHTINVTELIDAAPLIGPPSWIISLTFLILIADGYDIQSIAFAAPALAVSWGVKRQLLGPVLASGIVGMGIGSVLMGRLADRIGRKLAFCICIGALSAGSLLSAASSNLDQLVLFRFLTGLGLGGAAPLAASLSAEWTPARWRSLAVAIVIVGVPLGGMLGAVVAEQIIPSHGWRSVFLVGAISPVLLLVLSLPKLPESPKYLVGRPMERQRLARALNRLQRGTLFTGSESFSIAEPEPAGRIALVTLVRAPFLATSLLLWTAFSCNTLALYGFVNWLPTVLSASGISLGTALRGSVWFNSGGIIGSVAGSLLIGTYGSRNVGTSAALAGCIAATALGVITSSADHTTTAMMFSLVVLAGASLNGMQAFLYTVSAHSYPTYIRGTGMGAAAAVSRIGGVLSSVVGSAFFAAGLSVGSFFYILAAVILITAVSFFALRRQVPPRRKPA